MNGALIDLALAAESDRWLEPGGAKKRRGGEPRL